MAVHTSLEFKERKSSLSNNIPLILMLHGFGSDENDLFSFANELPEKYHIVSLKAPYKLEPYGNAWYAINFDNDKGKWNNIPQAKSSIELVVNFIKSFITEKNIDQKNVTLLGFSQGTILSYAIALNYPKLIKNIIGLSGYLDHDMIINPLTPDQLEHINCFASHGQQDQVIPLSWAKESYEFMLSKGLNIDFKSYPVGHGVAPQNFYDLRKWLSSH